MQPTGEWLGKPGGLAERLERMRKAAGLTGERMAERLGWPRTKISKLENGRQMPTAADIEGWAAACGREDEAAGLLDTLAEAQVLHRQWRRQLRSGHAAVQEDYGKMVREAKQIRNFEPVMIPGLLQTPDYARGVIEQVARVQGTITGDIDVSVAARMHRQDVLYGAGREFEFVIWEAALMMRIAPAAVMAGQMDRLLTADGLGSVTLGIIPFAAQLEIVPLHGFLMLDDVTIVETQTSHDTLRDAEAAAYGPVADMLRAEAVTSEEARRLIVRAAAAYRER